MFPLRAIVALPCEVLHGILPRSRFPISSTELYGILVRSPRILVNKPLTTLLTTAAPILMFKV